MTTQTLQTSQHTHKCAQAPVQLLPRRRPRGQGALPTRHLLLADLQRLAHLAPLALPSWPSSSSSRPIGSVPAPTRSVWAAAALEACRDKGGLVRGEGVGVGVLCAPEAAGTSTAVVIQPLLRT